MIRLHRIRHMFTRTRRAPAPRQLHWTPISSAELRSGRYRIVHDWNDPEVQVLVDGQAMRPGFGSIAEAKDWCNRHRLGVHADAAMTASARNMIPNEED